MVKRQNSRYTNGNGTANGNGYQRQELPPRGPESAAVEEDRLICTQHHFQSQQRGPFWHHVGSFYDLEQWEANWDRFWIVVVVTARSRCGGVARWQILAANVEPTAAATTNRAGKDLDNSGRRLPMESLIYWRDVKKSGIVFGAGLSVLIAMSLFSLISVFSYVSLLVLFGTVSFRIYKNVLQAVQKTAEGHPFKEYLDFDLTLSQEKVQQLTTVAVAHFNALLSELRRLFLVEDLVDSIKFGVVLYCLTYVGAIFNGMTCVIIAFIALFTLPKVYENNKQSIDAYLELVRSKILEITEKVKASVPLGKKVEADKEK
ncbi:ER protein reticulon [Culex quinquefasciatus]|uniref:Reticulon-like protein n=1 Tax=Culex quinquefasciatus TaxID=7176 RepID=B0WCF4_CULQU|nr:ER protein reticulon [Culex quinquefasciatus]|eukprot:XP_001846388.1 ER protein reticulon [Culex quinquefasciatus]